MTWSDSEFQENLHSLLLEKKFDTVLGILKDPKNDDFVLQNMWNIINTICFSVRTESLLKSDTDFILCKKTLMFLVNKGNPKEVLLSLLEHADSFKDNGFFCLLLDPLQYTLQKTPGKRGKSLQWVFSTLNAHIETLNLPGDVDLQGDETLLLDTDPAVQDAAYILKHYLSFVDFFVNEVSFDNLKEKDVYYFQRIANQQELLHRYILKLFNYPFLYHDLHVISDSRPKSNMQALCESYIKCLSKICKNVFKLFKYRNKLNAKTDYHDYAGGFDDDEDNVCAYALSNLSYLIFVENLTVDFQPFVYSHQFIFTKNLKYILLFLESKRNLVLFKGLSLAEILLSRLDEHQLDYDCMDSEAFTKFPVDLLDIAILCKFQTHRKSAINIFRLYISKCNSKGRYHLIMHILTTIKHSGAEGLVISLYKNNFHSDLNDNKSDKYFLGKNCNLFIRKVFVLKEGVETDILANSDRIMSSLNFLRYLFLLDVNNKYVVEAWQLNSYILKRFIEPLTMGLNLSRAHYKQAMLDAVNESKETKSVETTVSVNNEILPSVPIGLKKDFYKKALMTFDVIESILARVKELFPD